MTDDKKKPEDEDIQSAENADAPESVGSDTDSDSTGKDEAIDFDKEIENLDEFLMESEEEDIILDDEADEEHVLTASRFNKDKKRGGAGKYAAYGAFVLLLCGLGYAAVVYAPQYLKNPDLAAFEQTMANRTADIVGDGRMVIDTTGVQPSAPAEPQEVAQTPQPPQDLVAMDEETSQIPSPPAVNDVEIAMVEENADPLPMAMDEVEADAMPDEAMVELATDNIDETETEMPVEVTEAENSNMHQEAAAETIADALAITQSAQNEAVVEPETVLEETASPDTPVETDVDAALNDAEMATNVSDAVSQDATENSSAETDRTSEEEVADFGIERTRATSLSASRQTAQVENEDNLPPLEDDTIQIANDVMQMPPEEVEDVVEAVDNTVENVEESLETLETTEEQDKAIIKEAVKETVTEEIVETQTETDTANQDVVESTSVNEPKMAPETQVDEVEIVEVDEVVSEPKTVTAPKQNRLKPEDPRIATAKQYMSTGRYTEAATLYNAILMDDPANTRALTGRQLAETKLRANGIPDDTSTDYASGMMSAQVSSDPMSNSRTFRRTLDDLDDNQPVAMPVIGNERTVYGTPSALRLREKLRRAEAGGTSTDMTEAPEIQDDFSIQATSLRPVPAEPVDQSEGSITRDDIVFYDAISSEKPMELQPSTQGTETLPLRDTVAEDNAQEPVELEPFGNMDAADVNNEAFPSPAEVVSDAKPQIDRLSMMITEAEANPSNTALAVTIGDHYRDRGQKLKARDWYRTALRNDATYKTGLDRMAIYDRLAGVR